MKAPVASWVAAATAAYRDKNSSAITGGTSTAAHGRRSECSPGEIWEGTVFKVDGIPFYRTIANRSLR